MRAHFVLTDNVQLLSIRHGLSPSWGLHENEDCGRGRFIPRGGKKRRVCLPEIPSGGIHGPELQRIPRAISCINL